MRLNKANASRAQRERGPQPDKSICINVPVGIYFDVIASRVIGLGSPTATVLRERLSKATRAGRGIRMLRKKQDIIETALRLFEEHGYRAVGIDRIIAESGVAKMTMYNHFRSKDDLVVAVLHERDQRTRASLAEFVGRARRGRPQIRAIFQWLDQRIKCSGFSGCMFVNAVSEYGNDSGDIARAAAEHKASMQAYFETVLMDSVPERANALARQLMMLVDGAIVSAQVSRRADSADSAREIFSRLLPEPSPGSGGAVARATKAETRRAA
ncbi:TetR/AcrR family transcriptional regulator [Paraburkholderia sp. CNPSo 3281]|uniref:TetR/AcrR family transcriptional regulator n=1 Tax=Paraburkholderia sp. CNPSo 3281 TaxID=2940933 RepID=UPI0020B74D61|nr:TetR/AcrR family transcriptional regulator [Paraburkholderia sp. CNPSo 3281]MCP3717387.1 TetR/AcrR family transcriptional regulator [Paraburkholderia sp. CNPSo 3281]